MRRLAMMLIAAAVLAGCYEPLVHGVPPAPVEGDAAVAAAREAGIDAPERWAWSTGLSSDALLHSDRVNDCMRCHYGATSYWRETTTATWDGGNLSYQTQFMPKYPQTTLYALQWLPPGIDPVLWDSGLLEGTWEAGEELTLDIDVPEGAGGVLAHLYNFNAAPGEVHHVSLVGGYDAANSTLTLHGRDGTVAADSPGPDQQILSAAVAGNTNWTLRATLDDAPTWGMEYHLRAWVMRAPFHDKAATAQSVGFQVPAQGDGAPRDRVLHVWTHHEHDDVERDDYDATDLSPWTVRHRVAPVEAPRTWSQEDIDAIWSDDVRRHLGSWGLGVPPAYADSDDRALYWWHAPHPVPPGTSYIEAEATLPVSVDTMDFQLFYSTPTQPRFIEAQVVEESPGFARYRIDVAPEDWEDPDQAYWPSDRNGPRHGTWQFLPKASEPVTVAGLGTHQLVHGVEAYAVRE